MIKVSICYMAYSKNLENSCSSLSTSFGYNSHNQRLMNHTIMDTLGGIYLETDYDYDAKGNIISMLSNYNQGFSPARRSVFAMSR
jgi:hypothetical protein